MDVARIACLSKSRLSSKCRLLASACCPDKDLVVLLTRFNGVDKMSLWKLQGSKKWEFDTHDINSKGSMITAISWSPNGGLIVVAHHPPKLSLHSIEDGHVVRILHVQSQMALQPQITSVWWFKDERVAPNIGLNADIFQRGYVITESACSILKTQLLLDPIDDDIRRLNGSSHFNVQNVQEPSDLKTLASPPVISLWPSLPSNSSFVCMQKSAQSADSRSDPDQIEVDKIDINTLLVAVDDIGQIHCFLDGSYSLGKLPFKPDWFPISVFKNHIESTLLVQAEHRSRGVKSTTILPIAVELPLLNVDTVRRVAENCTVARELTYYVLKTVVEMRRAWFGEDGLCGAREMNANWVRGILEKQAQFGQQECNAISDLTHLLTTGRASDALSDFLSSGEQTSERGLQKWEAIVTEALIKIRDCAEKQLLPACQRLHVLLNEVKGWSLSQRQFSVYVIVPEEVDVCLNLTKRCVFFATWLTMTTRRELLRFKEFMSFLRYECSRGHPGNPDMHTILPRHDILEVNSYLISGLVRSQIDQWFIGLVPQSIHYSVSQPLLSKHLPRTSLGKLNIVSQLNRSSIQNLSHPDRNPEFLIQDLAGKCQLLYTGTSQAATRTAHLDSKISGPLTGNYKSQTSNMKRPDTSIIREYHDSQPGKLQYSLIFHIKLNGNNYDNGSNILVIVREIYDYSDKTASSCSFEMAAICFATERSKEYCVSDKPGVSLHLFDLQFFDKDNVILVYGFDGSFGPAIIAMIDCSDNLSYQPFNFFRFKLAPNREDALSEMIHKIRIGEVKPVPLQFKKQRALSISKTEGLMLAVNGRVGRRVACILDGFGTEMEIFDMEGEENGLLEADGQSLSHEGNVIV